ncbi:hypothetical protein [Saccharopolyspora sp. ASAGF58]|uniref:hypothetical protein n=1 Tax=Saccharopolyspora sp. ASAGF58 TaxID=2719023 RepID=UPI00143FC977|nr:hypothetical protein [Saccharopolyspora sp. ASAGF58]QIZ37197.1 hypothetical protein FDZ84_24440 [Saccharopolyspora sp. ASAGF58]
MSPELDVDTLFGQMIELGAAQTDHPTGFYWTFSKDPQDWNADCMMVGVRGDVAALEWFT